MLSSRYSRRLITLEKVRCISEHTIHLTCVMARQRVAMAPGTAVAVEDHMCASTAALVGVNGGSKR